ncbi:uncharacterized protein LODBEIA_P25530 [Lodderomyces beijingensis]|uniref:Ubiquitin-conjugating enzyme E2C-binding protein n=1 Tax=Lodderomyces beijingensis TaxID=1775926 RepID=A0ABP0ZKC7_9ASCO
MQYAEFLPRLNQITISVSELGVSSDKVSKVELETGNSVCIFVSDSSTPLRIRLPIDVENIQLRSRRVIESTLTLSLAVTAAPREVEAEKETVEKWSCKWLSLRTPRVDGKNRFEFVCRSCQLPLIQSGNHVFKDMPTEFWYEFMDFWHCHKPEVDQPTDKDYGVLKPADAKTIIIGSFYLLQSENPNIEKSQDDDSGTLVCKRCRHALGTVYQNNVLRILKWRISLRYNNNESRDTSNYSAVFYVFDLLSNSISSHATRKFKLKVENGFLYLWVMSTDVDIAIGDRVLRNSLKIWVSSQLPSDESKHYEEIEIPYEDARDCFLQSLSENTIIPALQVGPTSYSVSVISPS